MRNLFELGGERGKREERRGKAEGVDMGGEEAGGGEVA